MGKYQSAQWNKIKAVTLALDNILKDILYFSESWSVVNDLVILSVIRKTRLAD